MRLRPILGLVSLVACGSVGRQPAGITIASTLQQPVLALPSPRVAEDAHVKALLDEASVAMEHADRGRASRAALEIACGKSLVTAKDLPACPPPRSADVSSGWALIGELAFEGNLELGRVAHPAVEPKDAGPLMTFTFDDLEVNGANPDQLPLAELAFERALRVTPSRMPRAMVLYKLGWAHYRLDHFDAAIGTFLDALDEVRANRPAHAGDKLDVRDEALEYAAISIAETDWNGDGQDDLVRGFDRPEVQVRLKRDTPDMPDLYARVVEVLLEQAECADANDALAATTKRFPNHPKLAALAQSVARLCP